MSEPNGQPGPRSAMAWLAAAAPEPGACRWEWERNPRGVVLLPAGRRWDVLVLPPGIGHVTLEVLDGVSAPTGPVLADDSARVGYFVPPGTAGRWIGTGVRAAGRGSWIVVPHPARTSGGVHWLVPPDGSGLLTDPEMLELAMHEAAALVRITGTGTGSGAGRDARPEPEPGPGQAPEG
ncbi:hypothetical protein [Streptomyces sp. YIM 98790]|uniref:hypothetical protein n=1 Tax=Streptomyces sp. YIM 98790 TaxID=2689077 RepID=UPI001FB7A286|nr:hypothetical protein [Streptomyces sp. YIM 98790]